MYVDLSLQFPSGKKEPGALEVANNSERQVVAMAASSCYIAAVREPRRAKALTMTGSQRCGSG
jgi:hypothetical protein